MLRSKRDRTAMRSPPLSHDSALTPDPGIFSVRK